MEMNLCVTGISLADFQHKHTAAENDAKHNSLHYAFCFTTTYFDLHFYAFGVIFVIDRFLMSAGSQ